MTAIKKNTNKNSSIAMPVLCLLYLAGVVGGVFIGHYNANVNPLFLPLFSGVGQAFIPQVVSSFTPAFLFLFVTFMMGFGAIFAGFIPLVLVYRGLGIGTALAGLTADMSVRGATFAILLIVPFAVYSGLVLAVAVRESMRLSVSIFKVTNAQGGVYAPIDYRLYINKYIILSALMLAGAFADGFITLLFGKLVNY
jgi:hypothetical protein